jgi:hypothetical protein
MIMVSSISQAAAQCNTTKHQISSCFLSNRFLLPFEHNVYCAIGSCVRWQYARGRAAADVIEIHCIYSVLCVHLTAAQQSVY